MFKAERSCVSRIACASCAVVLSLVAGLSRAQAQVTLPDLGVDVAGTATAIGTGLGSIVATTITIFGAFLIVRYGLMWIRKTVK